MSARRKRSWCGRCSRIYDPVLRWSLDHRRMVVAFGLLVLIGTGFLARNLGSEFLPALEEGNMWIRASMPLDHLA